MKLPRKKKTVRVEMLPLMDVVFLLLVFFIYAMMSMAVHRGMKVELPASETAELERAESLALTVRADGSMFLDREPVSIDDLEFKLKAKNSGVDVLNAPALQVFADEAISYRELYKVLDKIKLAGIRKISLQAGPEGTQ